MGMAVTRKENSHSNIGNNSYSGKSVNSGSGIFATVTGKKNQCLVNCYLMYYSALFSFIVFYFILLKALYN